MLTQVLRKNKFSRKAVHSIGSRRAQHVIKQVQPFLKNKILDIGCGMSVISEQLIIKGYNVTSLDISNKSYVDSITPITYDGKKMPFKDKTYDTAIIMSVLHHTANPEEIIAEAKRVAKEVVIMEDIYDTTWDRWVTLFFDSLFNLEFKGHPHSNKTDKQWKQVFKKHKLKILNKTYTHTMGRLFYHGIYHLKT